MRNRTQTKRLLNRVSFIHEQNPRRPQRHSTAPKTKDRKTIDTAATEAYDVSLSDGAIQSGKGKFLTSPPHTTGHAGPHPAVH